MTVKSVLMDQVLQDPENPSLEDHLLTIDIKVQWNLSNPDTLWTESVLISEVS